MLAEADIANVAMAPAADMFEIGAKVQVLKRGTLFAQRGQKLYSLYRSYDNLESLPAEERENLERHRLFPTCQPNGVGLKWVVPRVFPQADGFDVKVNIVEDQDEPHVHVYKAGAEYRVSLVTGRVLTSGGAGSTRAQARAAEQLVQEHIDECWEEWKKWHP